MRKLMLAAGLIAVALPAVSATAQPGYRNREVRQEKRECRRELRRSESRREFNRELRECNRELARARSSRDWGAWDRRWRRW